MAVMIQPVQTSAIGFPRYEGLITVAPNGRYFQDEKGQSFLVIGQNDATSWPGLAELFEEFNPNVTEQYVMDLRAHGVTVSRIMMEYAQHPSTYLENPVGLFTPTVVHFWDEFITLAEKHGLYLLLTPYDTFWQARYWDQYPYNKVQGGPCGAKIDWLMCPNTVQAQKARWEFIIRRWGDSPNIFAWDLMNEIELWWGTPLDVLYPYITEMAAYVRQLESSIWGHNHLLTVSSSAAVPQGVLAEAIYNHPALDFANTHLYVDSGVKEPTDVISAAPEIIGAVEESLASIRTPRPYFDSETGPLNRWPESRDFDKRYHHHMSWAHLATGGAGSGMRWPYTQPHHLLPDLRENLRGMARFAAQVNWTEFNSAPVRERLTVDHEDIIRTGCADEHMALLWLLCDSRRDDFSCLSGVTVSLCDTLQDGEYTVELWETYDGCLLTTMMISVKDGVLSFQLPHFGADFEDIAILIRRAEIY